MYGNAAIDQERKNALEEARMRSANADPLRVPQHGRSDNYHQNSKADNYPQDSGSGSSFDDEKNKKNRVGKLLDQNKEKQQMAKIAKMATPMGILGLLKEVRLLEDMPYVAAIGAALFKDLVDIALTSYLPTTGAITAVMASIFNAMMIFLAGAGQEGKVAKRFMKKFLALGAGTIVEAIPGIDFFPVETITVGIIYAMTLMERKMEKN